jgi:hypothetical protein
MGKISPAYVQRMLSKAFVPTSAALVAGPVTPDTLRREYDAWGDEPAILRCTKRRRAESKFRYENAEHFFLSIEAGRIEDREDILYLTGIVMQLGISAHLFEVGFTDDWCRRHIGLRIAKSLGYANATGLDYHNSDTNLLAAILTPYGKWRNPAPWDQHDDGPFTTDEIRQLTRALLDHVHHVTGHPRPTWWETRHV